MENITEPQVINMPFCANGNKNTIPSSATGTQRASLEEGFPEITSKPIAKGGIPPEREDFNGAMNLNSQFYFAFQNGWWPTFSADVSTAIGGYPLGSVLWWFPETGSFAGMAVPVKSLVASNTYNFNTNSSYIGVYWKPLYKDPSSMPIGTVFMHQSSNAEDVPGALPLFTGEVIGNADQRYPDFYAWVLAHTDLCKTEAEWQTAITTYGECPYYVIDATNKTIRLPKLGNYIKMANTTDGITQSAADLTIPNHYHIFGNNEGNNSGHFVSTRDGSTVQMAQASSVLMGARFWNGSNSTATLSDHTPTFAGNMATTTAKQTTPADSSSDGIFGGDDSIDVNPAHTTVFPWVFAYNAAIPASTAQAAEFQQALSEKVDKADLSEVQCVVEAYTNGSSWYRVWSDGWCEQGGKVVESSNLGYRNVTINLLKPYINTDYTVQLTSRYTGNNTSGGTDYADAETTSSFTARIAGTGYSWTTVGRIR